MGQDEVPVWEAGWHDCVREGDRGRQLDQGNVITARVETIHPHSGSEDKQNMTRSTVSLFQKKKKKIQLTDH